MADQEVSTLDESKVATPASIPMSEMQMQLAQKNPRDEVKVFKNSIRELEMLPEYAEEAYYSIPYKDREGSESGKITQVEGLSIKAAMSLARRWGNCANGARVADERDERIICQGMFFDYETNVLTLRDVSVSKIFRTKEGRTIRLNSSRMNMAIQAGQSKAVRNAILATLPASLKEAYFKTARTLVINPPPKQGEVMASVKDRIEKGKKILIEKFAAKKEEIDRLISEWMADSDGQITDDDILANLIGLKNAIKEGHITADIAFGRQDKPAPGMPQEKPAVSGPAQNSAS